MVNQEEIYIFPIADNVYKFIEQVWSSFVNKMVALCFSNDENIFQHSIFEVIQDQSLRIVASSTYFMLKEIANKKGDKDVKEFMSKTKPTPLKDPLNLSAKVIQRAILDFTAGHRPNIEYVNIREQVIHENLDKLRTETMNYAVGLPLFVKENPIGILWGIRKEPFTASEMKEVTRQLCSLFDVIEFVTGKELDGKADAYFARKNIEKADANSMSKFLFYTTEKNQKDPVTSIIFKSHGYEQVYRLDASYIIPTSNGYSVSLKKFTPEQINNTKINLLMIPGFFCRRSVMDKLAREMALQYGYRVFSMDMRGRSRQTLPPNGIQEGWTMDDYIQDDFPAVIRWLKEHYPAERTVVFGHSMGGMIARFYTSAYDVIKRLKKDSDLPNPQEHIAGIVSITSPNYVTLKTSFPALDAIKMSANMLPHNAVSDVLFNLLSTSLHSAVSTIDLNKFFRLLLNMHSSLRQFSFSIGTQVVTIKDFVGYKQISPSEWYFLIEDIFCEESTKVILQFARSQLSPDRSFLSYDGKINYNAEQRNFNLPIYSVLGTVDKIVPPEVLEEDLIYFTSKNKEMAKFEQGHLGIVFHLDTVRKMCRGLHDWIQKL